MSDCPLRCERRMANVRRMLDAAYDPETFRKHAHALVDALADHLARPTSAPVVPWVAPRDNVAAWASTFSGGADPAELFRRVIEGSTHLHHPGFVGHQVTSPLPIAALGELVSGFLNNGTAVYEMGPVSTAIERVLARFLASRLGYGDGADAIFTSGGSAGNLTALLAARAAAAERAGAARIEAGAVIACEEAHYSTARAVRIMGWGDEGLYTVASDDRFRMRAELLPRAVAAAERAGRRVVAVVASACSTSTGAFDPLPLIADFCEERGIWMHVDGAHGASFALSPKHKGLVAGIERADSVVWDAHKMLLSPALVTAVVFQRRRDSFAAFAGTDAAYLLDEQAEMDGALRTLECTKRMIGLGLYAALAVHGEPAIASYLDGIVDRARAFAEKLERTEGFSIAVRPECNIVCFRYGEDDAVQERIRKAVLEDGRFYVVKTRLRGKTWLRVTIINPRTSAADLDRLIEVVRSFG